MKKFFKALIAILILAVLGITGVTSYNFYNYAPNKVDHTTNKDQLVYFQESYDACRKEFISLSKKATAKFKNTKTASLMIESKKDQDLTINYCYIPAQKQKKNLLVISSGIHGVEGFVGSAVQQMILAELLDKKQFDNMGMLLIHGLNPFGMKYLRRVSENNVDLNRNSTKDDALYKSINSGYSNLYNMLNPKEKVSLFNPKNLFFHINAALKIAIHSMKVLRQAVLQGQYQYPEGLYFGGKELEPSIKAVTPLIIETSLDYQTVFTIDLHTGYGERGTLHLFPNPIEDKQVKADIKAVFQEQVIDWGNDDDFYTITGNFSDYIGKILPDKYALPMVFEFGTLDSQTTMGALKSLHNMVVENQGFHYGYSSQKHKQRITSNLMEMYYPSSLKWRSKAISDARKLFIQIIERYPLTEK